MSDPLCLYSIWGNGETNFELLGDVLVLVDIDGYQIDLLAHEVFLGGDLFEGGGEQFAGLAPGCEEVDEHGHVGLCTGGLEHTRVECRRIHVLVHLGCACRGTEAPSTPKACGGNANCSAQHCCCVQKRPDGCWKKRMISMAQASRSGVARLCNYLSDWAVTWERANARCRMQSAGTPNG